MGMYEQRQPETADHLVDQYQDKTVLIDLLITKEEQRFKELTRGKQKWNIVEQ
ncbi:hypothetical protein [Domibacillus robiginosus]|uniref:hypothetical protein n=1 Tax=Domibacillus robiginosus TaxID=1071054 RepID=UPI000B11A6C6|nr:hypothetical protein [Domibacillus robiginosus]